MNLSLASQVRLSFFKLPEKRKITLKRSLIRKIMQTGFVSAILFVATSLQLLFGSPVKSQTIDDVKIHIGLNNETLVQAFHKIEAHTSFRFMYRNDEVQNIRNLDVKPGDRTVGQLLRTILSETSLTYRQVNNQVLIMPSEGSRSHYSTKLISSPRMPEYIPKANIVKGRVTNAQGSPMSGVSVTIKGTQTGTLTDENGNYSLDVPATGTLVFSFVGFASREIPVNGRAAIDVVLEASVSELEQVVVVGYGTQKKSEVIGSISQVDAKEINDRPVSQVSQAIAGQMPGVTAIQRSGQPGASGANIQIRGINSFGASTAALIIVDGIPVTSMDNISPENIQSISVLKDASSAAIYGARAANGVILITTKIGSRDHQLHLSYNAYISSQRATQYPRMVNSWEYATLQNEAEPGSWTDAQIDSFRIGTNKDLYPNTNWVDLVFKKGTLQTNHNISLRNSSENTDYYLALGYLYQDGIVLKNSYNRYNVRFNMTNRIARAITLKSNISGNRNKNVEPAPPATMDWNDMLTNISQVVRFPPIYPNKLSNGDWGTGVVNKGTPVSYMENASFFKSNESDMIINEKLEVELVKNLKASLVGGYSESIQDSKRFLSNQRINSNITLGPGNLTQSNTKVQYTTLQELLQYDNGFGNHKINILLGHSFEDTKTNLSSLFRNNYNSNLLTEINAGDVSTQTNDGTSNEWALDSYFGRLQYSYADKYLIQGDFRRDGSSRFPQGNKYANFPAVAVGWRLSRENFIRDNDNFNWLNDFKFRASFGTLGNQNIGNYPFQSILSPGYNYPFGGVINTGLAIAVLNSSVLHWESTQTKDIGFDATFLGNMFSLGVTYYNKRTYNILVSPGNSVSDVLGFGVGPQNSGKLSNKGWEFTAEHQKRLNDFRYDISANFSIIKNKVLDLGVGNVTQPNGLVGNGSNLFIGYPVNLFYGYEADGLFKDQESIDQAADQTAVNPNPRPGDVKYKDINGPDGKPDGKITPAYDRTVIGTTLPKYSYGVSLNVGYKRLSLSVLLQGVASVKGQLNNYAGYAFYNTASVQQWQMDDRWTTSDPNPKAKYPRMEIMSNAGTPNTLLSSYWMLNASYLRVKNIQLGYSLPDVPLRKIGVSALRLYLTAENLFTIDHYPSGWDPEINSSGSYYPILANYTFGINLEF